MMQVIFDYSDTLLASSPLLWRIAATPASAAAPAWPWTRRLPCCLRALSDPTRESGVLFLMMANFIYSALDRQQAIHWA